MDKYEYLFGKHLGYKPGAVEQVKFEYSPLSKGFNQFLKKDDKVNKDSKYSNDLRYDSVHNFNKYSLSSFNEISSIDSKFDTLDKFYKDFFKLKKVKSTNKKTNQKKIFVLKNALLLYNGLINIYEKNTLKFLRVNIRLEAKT